MDGWPAEQTQQCYVRIQRTRQDTFSIITLLSLPVQPHTESQAPGLGGRPDNSGQTMAKRRFGEWSVLMLDSATLAPPHGAPCGTPDKRMQHGLVLEDKQGERMLLQGPPESSEGLGGQAKPFLPLFYFIFRQIREKGLLPLAARVGTNML